MSIRTVALVPAKCFASAKSRLSRVLDEGERERLARSMLEHVLAAIAGASRISATYVVTDCDDVEELSRGRGATVLRDASAPPLGAIVDGALGTLASRGERRALVVMSDLPRLHPDDLDALAASESGFVVAPDVSRLGTNALGLDLPLDGGTCFGRVDSFEAHREHARRRGVACSIVERPGVAFDVDGEDDLAALRARAS